MGLVARRGERVQRARRVAEEEAAPRVDDERDLVVSTATALHERRGHERWRKVVEDVVVEIFEDLDGLCLPRSGHPCDHDEARRGRLAMRDVGQWTTLDTRPLISEMRMEAMIAQSSPSSVKPLTLKPTMLNPVCGIADTM